MAKIMLPVQASRELLLEEYLKKGQKVYALHQGASGSGMTHYIRLFVGGTNNQGDADLFNITFHAAIALGEKLVDRDGVRCIKVTGGGMDMGFHLVYNLGRVLFEDGYALNHQKL